LLTSVKNIQPEILVYNVAFY